MVSFRKLPYIDEAWTYATSSARLSEICRAGPKLRGAIRDSGTLLRHQTFDIALFPYPAKYAFQGACTLPFPFAFLTNRAIFAEYLDLEGEKRRIIINPSTPEGARRAPFFAQLLQKIPKWSEPLLSRQYRPLEEQLRNAGIEPETIDYITFDHLHVQQLTTLLGPNGLFSKASLLVTANEYNAARRTHPLQKHWYVEDAFRDVPQENIKTFEHDLLLGEGLALVRTPGHTEGNHSICLHTLHGLYTVSENGVCLDSYCPRRSSIPGLVDYAERRDIDFVLNANTLERSLDQYASMKLESIISAPASPDGFPLHFSSSELTPFYLAPTLEPTETIGKLL
ncbi:MAG: hypothetical protein VYC39_17165 [Myxococcota bacterium]|nr:hypothetical protein [Myxococcota bacterium]